MKLQLYYRQFCPFCRKVLAFLEENKVESIELKNLGDDPEFEKTLEEIHNEAL